MKAERPEKTLERVSLQICWIICGLFIIIFLNYADVKMRNWCPFPNPKPGKAEST